MKTIIVRDFTDFTIENKYVLDLQETTVKDCRGCWSCWLKTPGRCVYSDLNKFYYEFINADRVIILLDVHNGFISGNMKSFFDRNIPHYLPYISYQSGESMHLPRYEKYPAVEIYYNDCEGKFASLKEQEVLEAYLERTLYQFYIKDRKILPISKLSQEVWQ